MNKNIKTLFNSYFFPNRVFKKKLPIKFKTLVKFYKLLIVISIAFMVLDWITTRNPLGIFSSLTFFIPLATVPFVLYFFNKKVQLKKTSEVFMLSTGLYLIIQPLAFIALGSYSLNYNSGTLTFSTALLGLLIWAAILLIFPLLTFRSLLIGYSTLYKESKLKIAIIIIYHVIIPLLVWNYLFRI